MTDESKLQVTRNDGESSLTLSKARSGLVTRGRRDAALLVKPLVPEPMDWVSETHKRAEEGDVSAQWDLAVGYFAGDSRLERALVNSGEWVRWMRKLADQNDDGAQAWLGEAYEWGIDVPQDYAESVRWYRKAAELGNRSAQFSLGFAYDAGQGVLQDKTEAVKWYRGAAEKGHDGAQLNLGAAYKFGEGIVQDQAEAIRWFRKAAEQGSKRAQTLLGHAYSDGEVVPQDYDEAAQWFRKAAEQGYPYAQSELAVAYRDGRGVPRDYVHAHLWFHLAAESYPVSDDRNRHIEVLNRDALAVKMTPEQITEAGRLAREWKQKKAK